MDNSKKIKKQELKKMREIILSISYNYMQFGKFKKSIRLLRGLEHLFPKDSEVLSLLAYCYLNSKDIEKTKETINSLDQLECDSTTLHLLKAQNLQEMGCVEEAQHHYSLYIQHRENSNI